MAVATKSLNDTLYYLRRGELESGPFALSQLRSMWQSGAVPANAFYRFDPQAEWQPILNLRRLLDAAPTHPPTAVAFPEADNTSLVLPIVALVLSFLPVLCFAGLICAHLSLQRPRTPFDTAARVLTIIALVFGYLMAIQSLFIVVGWLHFLTMSHRMGRGF